MIYYINKPLRWHSLKLLEVYNELYKRGNIITLKKEMSLKCPLKQRKIDEYISPIIIKKNEWDKKLQSNKDMKIININWNLDGVEEVLL